MSTPSEFYQALPPVSRVWLTAAVLSGIGAKLRLVQPLQLALNFFDPMQNVYQVGAYAIAPCGRRARSPSRTRTGTRRARVPPSAHPPTCGARVQPWRLVTNFFFFGMPSFSWLMQMIML